MKQTAVDWLVEQLIPKAFAIYDITTHNAIQQAKQMEKEQIEDAFKTGDFENTKVYSAEDYYKEKYE